MTHENPGKDVAASEASKDSLVWEYVATNDAFIHYDNYSWNVGAVVIAGVFVFWGFLLNQEVTFGAFAGGSFLVAALMSLWLLYAHHNRQLYLCKFHRLHEIEKDLGFWQHRRFREETDDTPASPGPPRRTILGRVRDSFQKRDTIYTSFGPRGHQLDWAIYVVTSLGAPVMGMLRSWSCVWYSLGSAICFLLLLGLVTLVVAWTVHNERVLFNRLDKLANTSHN